MSNSKKKLSDFKMHAMEASDHKPNPMLQFFIFYDEGIEGIDEGLEGIVLH